MDDITFLRQRKDPALLEKYEKIKTNALREGKMESKLVLCFFLCYGMGYMKIDMIEAERLATQVSDTGNLLAIGMRSFYGWNTIMDYDKAHYCFETYLDQNYTGKKKLRSFALNMLGYMMDNGLGMKVDHKRAKDYYRRAIKLGNSISMNNLGYSYQYGIGNVVDFKKAFKYYKKAIILGNSDSMLNLALMYEKSDIEKKFDYSMKLLKTCIKVGCPLSPYYMARIYEIGNGVEKNLSKAIEYYNLGIERGDSSCLNNLALMYENGSGVEKNQSKAMELYNKAVSLGNSTSMFNLGHIYQTGEGVEKDYKRATQLFKHSHKLGSNFPLYFLGKNYKEGFGVKKNMEKACSYFYKGLQVCATNPDKYEKEFLEILNSKEVVWNTNYHKYWKGDDSLNERIFCLLQIFKYKNVNNSNLKKILVRGISMKIITYLCHVCQI